jgi:hypothetical protein
VVETFGYQSNNHVALRLWSLTKLDPKGQWREKAVRLVRAIAHLWQQKRQERASLQEAADQAGLSIQDAAVMALFLESEPWARGFHTGESALSEWRVGGDESVWAYRECQSWEEYAKLRMRDTPEHYDQFGKPDPVQPLRSLLLPYDEKAEVLPPVKKVKVKAKKTKAPSKKQSRPKYDYDVALSFAGEDRRFVEQVAEILAAYGLKVFYDAYEEDSLWGKDLYVHLDEVYRLKSRYCVLFASKHYAKKLWTSHERQSAQARAFRERQEYILPVRLDRTEIPGLRETVGYLQARKDQQSAQRVANAVAKKLGKYDALQKLLDYLKADLGPEWTVTQLGRNIRLACESEGYLNDFSIAMLLEAMRANQLFYFLESSILPR